jgi:hypothetical protein
MPSSIPLLSSSLFVDTNLVVISSASNIRFVRVDLGQRGLEGNRTLCRLGVSIAMIPTIHGTSFRGLIIIVLFFPVYGLHLRAVNYTKNRWRNLALSHCGKTSRTLSAVWKLRHLSMALITKWSNRKWGWVAVRFTISWMLAQPTFLKICWWTFGDRWCKDAYGKGLRNLQFTMSRSSLTLHDYAYEMCGHEMSRPTRYYSRAWRVPLRFYLKWERGGGVHGACSDIEFGNKVHWSFLVAALYLLAASFLAFYVEIILLRVTFRNHGRGWSLYLSSVLNT